jgi:hypothetical protein
MPLGFNFGHHRLDADFEVPLNVDLILIGLFKPWGLAANESIYPSGSLDLLDHPFRVTKFLLHET